MVNSVESKPNDVLSLPCWREVLIAAVSSFVVVFLLSWFTGLSPKLNGDEYLYLRQSENPLSVIGPPHGFRLLSTRLAWMLPIPQRAGFYVFTVTGIAGAFTLIYVLLRVIGCTIWSALAAMTALVFHRGIRECLFHYCLVDPMSFFLIELGILSLYLGKDGLFSTSLLLGVLNRATSLFLIPVYHFARWRRWWTIDAMLSTLLVCGLSIVAFLVTRFLLYSLSDEAYFASVIREYYDVATRFSRFDQFYLSELRDLITRPERWRELTSFSTLSAGLGVMAPMSLLGIWWGRRQSRALVFYLLCVWSQILYAHMVERLVFFAFPVFMILAGEAIRRIEEIPGPVRYGYLMILALTGVLQVHLAWIGIALGFLLVGLLWFYKRPVAAGPWEQMEESGEGSRRPASERKKNSTFEERTADQQQVVSFVEPNLKDCVRVGVSYINVALVFVVIVNLVLIYVCRPTLIGRLQSIIPQLERVQSVRVGSLEPVIVGDGDVIDVSVKDKKLKAFYARPGGGGAYAIIPAKSPLFRGYKKMVVVAIAYPVQKSRLCLAVSRPDVNTGKISLQGRQAVEIRFEWETQLNLINKSYPFECSFESPIDYLVIWATEGVYVADAFFLECEKYTMLQRPVEILPDDF